MNNVILKCVLLCLINTPVLLANSSVADELFIRKEWRYVSNFSGQEVINWQLYQYHNDFTHPVQHWLPPSLMLLTPKYQQGLMLNVSKLQMEYVPHGNWAKFSLGITL